MDKQLVVRCVSAKPFLSEERNGTLRQGQFEGALISLTVGKFYEATEGGRGYFRIVDDTGEDYLYPKSMFEIM